MAWNHKSRVIAMAIAIQAVAGVFTAPTNADIMAVSVPNNNFEALTADDPTATGTVWASRRIYLGKSGTAGATYPLRGPGGAGPPVANDWVPGRVFQAAGWSEIRNAAAIPGVLQAGATTNVTLAAGASAVDNLYLGAPLQQANLGTGFRQTTLMRAYNGATKVATLAETIVAPAAGDAYTIPAYLSYVLGTLTTAPPLLSISVWRDKKRYDYKDWRPTSFRIDVPVANEANSVFPSIDFSGRGIPNGPATDEDAPAVPAALLNLPLAPARAGKFYLDGVKLGHQSISFTESVDVGAASNQNQDQGQDAYDITGGNRTVSVDLNQMNVTDLDLDARIDNQTIVPFLSTWGIGAGNRFGLLLPNNVLDPLNPGDRNGYVNLTGDAHPTDVDKSAAFTIWW